MKKFIFYFYTLLILLLPCGFGTTFLSYPKIIFAISVLIFMYNIIKNKADVKKILNKKSFKIITILYFTLFILMLTSISINTILNNNFVINNFIELLRPVLYFLIFFNYLVFFNKYDYKEELNKSILISFLIQFFIALIEFFNPFNVNNLFVNFIASTQTENLLGHPEYVRTVGLADNPNVFSLVLVLYSIYFIYKIFKKQNISLYIILYIMCYICLFTTMSRTGLICLVASNCIYIFLHNINSRKIIPAFLKTLFFIILVFFSLILLPQKITVRYTDMIFGKYIGSWEKREEILGNFISDSILNNQDNNIQIMDKENDVINYKITKNKTFVLMFGNGPDKEKAYHNIFDNEYLSLFFKYGILGLFNIIFIILSSVYIAYIKRNSKLTIPIISIVVAGCLSMYTSGFFEYYNIFISFIILISYVSSIKKKKIENEKNIIFVSDLPLWSMNNGSGGKAFFKTISYYIEKGINVYLVTNQENDYKKINLSEKKVYYFKESKLSRYKNIPKVGFLFRQLYTYMFKAKAINKMHEIIENNKESNFIIYSYEVSSTKACKFISSYYNFPLITRFQGSILYPYKNNILTKIRMNPHVSALSTTADLTIMTDDGTRGLEVLKKFGNENEIMFLRNGVNVLDNKLSPLTKVDKNKLLKQYNIPNDSIKLLTVSRLESWKKVERALYALSELLKLDNNKYHLIIVGDGTERKNLENLANKLNISKFVTFTGAIPNNEVYKYMQLADIFCSFYDLSNVGNPLLEALCLGKAIITYNVGDTKNIINKKNGVLLNDISAKNICKNIKKIVDNNKIKELEKGALEYANKNLYSWNDRMEMEYDKVEKIFGNT